ncbi:MAG: AAA family ATPase [Desulfobacteraceae bacterium]|jgi:DNA polymerase-3 subunit gamma/tau
MSLYRKYRPQTFDEIIGNKAEVEALQSKLASSSRPQSFLIQGPSGCGKTTLARIAARELGGDDLSIQEINTADNRGIDTAREVITRMAYRSPTNAPKVYIIDEVHKTTKDWQNAMLKPLEDTPSNVYFFLCTTDPEMLLKTIKTRCTTITVNALKSEDMTRLIRKVCLKEKLRIPSEIVEEIVEISEGSPRQALVNLEKVSELEPEEMLKALQAGEETEKKIGDLINAIKKGPWKSVAICLKSLGEEMDQESIRRAVIGYCNAVLLNGNKDPSWAVILENFAEPYWGATGANATLVSYQSYTELKR